MPKRKAKSKVAAAVGADNHRSKVPKKQKPTKSKSKQQQQQQSQHDVVASFARGLSHQIPTASLSHIANSTDSLRLLLEKSTESLPMGSAIRKAVGENFAVCVDALTKEVASRLAEEEEMRAKPSDDRKVERQAYQGEQDEEAEFAVFSAAQYEKALQKMKFMEDVSEREECRRRLASTPFASADVLIPLSDADQDVEIPSAKTVLGAFRSASLTGRVNERTMGGYVTRMLAAVRAEIKRSPVRSVSLIRNFLSCFAMSLCDKVLALMSGDGKTAFEYGELIGLMVHVALDRPDDYLSSAGDGDVEDTSSSCDESDVEDDLPRGSATKMNGKRSSQIVASAIEDATCNLTLHLLSVGLANPHVIAGIINTFLDGSDTLLHAVSSILAGVLINSSSAPKSAMPSKNIKSGKEKIRMIQRWVDGEIEEFGREREETVLSATTPIEHDERGAHDVHLYSSSGNEDDIRSDEEDSSSEKDGGDDDNKQTDKDTRSVPDESLFIIDAAPDDDAGDEDEANRDRGEEDEEETAFDEPTKKTRSRGAASGRPPRPPSSKATTATPNTLPRRSTRSRSRGDSMGSMGSLFEEGTPRRSARMRSRGDSISKS